MPQLDMRPAEEPDLASSEELPTLSMSQQSQPEELPTSDWGKLTIEFPDRT